MAIDGELQKQLHDHDVRLTRVETELQGVHKEIRAQREDFVEFRRELRDVAKMVSTLAGSHKILLWVLSAFGALIGGLELWAVFGQ